MSLLRDEQGSLSTARCAFWLTLIVTLVLIVLHAFGLARPPEAAYTLLGTVVLALAAWAGGPRIGQYIAPQIGRAAAALSRARAEITTRRKRSAEEHPGTEATP